MSINFITNEQLYTLAIKPVASATSFVWIGTANIKDLYVHNKGSVQSFLSILDSLVKKKISIRLLYAKEPGVNFKNNLKKYPLLTKKMESRICPRVHFKHIIIDGIYAYTGSANLTGAGLGIKSTNTRNFEAGIVTNTPKLIDAIMSQYNDVWMGRYCNDCKRKNYCNNPIFSAMKLNRL